MYQHRTIPQGGGAAVLAADRRGDYDSEPDTVGLPAVFDRLGQALAAAGDADPDGMSSERLAGVVAALHRAEAGVAALKSRWIAACQKARAYEADGAADTTAWLKDTLKVSGRQAKKTSERARRLKFLPDTADALSEGAIGTEHADILADAMDDRHLGDPEETERALLGRAREQTPDQLRATVRRLEQQADDGALADQEQQARARRSVRLSQRADGMWSGRLLLDPVAGETVKTALEAFTQPDREDTPPRYRRRPDQRRADGLEAMANAALGSGEAPQQGGVRPHISLLVDLETAFGEGTEPAQAEFSGPISPQATRKIMCDAAVTRIVYAPDVVVNVGRTRRSWSASQRRAVIALDGGCRWPGCDIPAGWSIVHHVEWFDRDNGRTDLANGVLLCWHHHSRVHDDGWRFQMDPDTRVVTVTSPDGSFTRSSRPQGQAASTHQTTESITEIHDPPDTTPLPPPVDRPLDPGAAAAEDNDHSCGTDPPRSSGTDPPCLPGF